MEVSRLILAIRENNVELIDHSTRHYNILKSVDIQKGDVDTAVRTIYDFVCKNNRFKADINFIIPSNEIKTFRIPLVSKVDKQSINSIAKNFLKNEDSINFSKLFYNIIEEENLVEIGVIERDKLLEGVRFIENIGFKVVDAVGNLKDPKRSFALDTKIEFDQRIKIAKPIIPKFFHFGIRLKDLISSKIFDVKPFIRSHVARNISFFGLALFATITLATAYFFRPTENELLLHPVSQKINLLPNKDTYPFRLAINLNKPLLLNLPFDLMEQPVSEKSIHKQLLTLVDVNHSEIKIKNPELKLLSFDSSNLLSEATKDTWTSSHAARTRNDPDIKFKHDLALISEKEAIYFKPKLNLKAPEQRTHFRPKIRPNIYPFEIKKIPKEYARPRLRPAGVEEIAAKSKIFSDTKLGQSIKPKTRPKLRKRIVVSDYSEEGDEANVIGTVSNAATKKSIVKLATTKNAINKRKLNVLSIYSRGSEKRAIVLFPSGQTKLVKVGDKLDGGRVAAIGTTEVRYIKGGSNLVLRIPQG